MDKIWMKLQTMVLCTQGFWVMPLSVKFYPYGLFTIIYIYSYKYMKIQRFLNMKKNQSFLWHKAEEFEVWNTYSVSRVWQWQSIRNVGFWTNLGERENRDSLYLPVNNRVGLVKPARPSLKI